jgi:hypothetical protein
MANSNDPVAQMALDEHELREQKRREKRAFRKRTRRPPVADELVSVSLCTNDPDNGGDTGRCCAIEVDELELRDWPTQESKHVVCRVEGSFLQFGRRRFAIHGHRDWVGNWCWRSVGMTRPDCRELLAYALKFGFSLDAFTEGNDLLPETQ